MNRPKFLILDFKEALKAFLYVVEDGAVANDLPTIDVESTLRYIFTCLISNDVAVNELAYYASQLLRDGQIVENLSELSEGQLDIIEQAIYDMGLACHAVLQQLKAYDQNNAFMYCYKGIVDDSSVLFEEIPPS